MGRPMFPTIPAAQCQLRGWLGSQDDPSLNPASASYFPGLNLHFCEMGIGMLTLLGCCED